MNNNAQSETDIQIAICGSAGDGTIAAGDILKTTLARMGYNVIAFDEYPPEIRGFGKCISRARFTTEQMYSIKPRSDMLVSLDDSHAIPHVGEVKDYGLVVYEDTPIAQVENGAHISAHIKPAHIGYGLPLRELSERATSGVKSRNVVVVGYIAGLYRLPADAFHKTISDKFRGKAAAVTETNLKAFDLGYALGRDTLRLDFSHIGQPRKDRIGTELVMMNGNQAIVKGCLQANISTFFGYPITPATSIMEGLAVEMPRHGGRLIQTEDEISAAAAVVGAGFAGSRSATSTSGPGLALMTEVLGMAAMAEVPSVFFVSQRGGPSTGMPTKTEQSDLNLAVHGVAGDGQRIVLAPTNVDGCYRCAGKAFELAEKFQTPVIVLLDLYLSNRFEAVELPASNPFELNCSKPLTQRDQSRPYHRFEITEDFISPRAVPGEEHGIHVITGLEHDERGRAAFDGDTHTRMSEKRHKKLLGALEHPDLTKYKRFGDEGKVRVGVLGWGSTYGEILEAIIACRKQGIACASMKVVMLSPFPVEAVKDFMNDCDVVLVPEVNYEGQFAKLVSGHTGMPVHSLTRTPAAPMQVDDIIQAIRNLAETAGNAQPHTAGEVA
ncbi:MAG: 2-oxoacid:acceptor oxidoreductase subunit alpha [Gammaproteobacteria bacterium]|nr:MAG: 2-oxoacid:acceptor oxidoreductase subunit alpha [Gammaproteobacteria bacterium]